MDSPHELIVELTPSYCGAAALELGDGAKSGACGLADGPGLVEGFVAFARPTRIRRSPHRAATAQGPPGWRRLDVGAARCGAAPTPNLA